MFKFEIGSWVGITDEYCMGIIRDRYLTDMDVSPIYEVEIVSDYNDEFIKKGSLHQLNEDYLYEVY